MARDRDSAATPSESVISIIGPGMTIVGDCETDGTLRVEGSVEGYIKAGKAVVIGKKGVVSGDITTQDAVISGRVEGTLVAASRLELQSTCHIEGDVHTRRMQLEEGAVLNGSVHMGSESPRAIEKAAPGERTRSTPDLGKAAAIPSRG
ncbi:MAG: polymer-forming cytoskeletal protein [Longimicrobiales bacterium]|nr:polymer-forming cytoskeletal protein [Longimicrobiales bacterium]